VYQNQDTIVAIATAQGVGGIGIVRISGKNSLKIAEQITKCQLKPRMAHYTNFYNDNNEIIDSGIALFFVAPNSFTGEDCVELQGHGGQVILHMLVETCLNLGARPAAPGEFSYRAFINNKIDLIQAEAISDLISATSNNAVRNALNSLRGDFSKKINKLNQQIIDLRVFLEATLDFPEEEITFVNNNQVQQKLNIINTELNNLLKKAHHGAIIQNGIRVVIAGAPNAGKSSLMNALAGYDVAIVTDIAGTTRDILRENIQINGIAVQFIDTAGLRKSYDAIEQIGISRALDVLNSANHIVAVIDVSSDYNLSELRGNFPTDTSITFIFNKIDLIGISPKVEQINGDTHIYLSAKTKNGIDLLCNHLTNNLDITNETNFSAKMRHINALKQVQKILLNTKEQTLLELIADDLRLASQHLSEITGEFTNDDLLTEIFSNFCIGK